MVIYHNNGKYVARGIICIWSHGMTQGIPQAKFKWESDPGHWNMSNSWFKQGDTYPSASFRYFKIKLSKIFVYILTLKPFRELFVWEGVHCLCLSVLVWNVWYLNNISLLLCGAAYIHSFNWTYVDNYLSCIYTHYSHMLTRIYNQSSRESRREHLFGDTGQVLY